MSSLPQVKVSYAPSFEDEKFVRETIQAWYNGSQFFTLHTSGSTGIPRPIKLKRKLLEWSAQSTYKALNLSEQERLLCCIPVKKTGGFMQLIRALYFGWNIHFVQPSLQPLANLETENYSFTSLTATQVQYILSKNKLALEKIDKVLIGGSQVSNNLTKDLTDLSNSYWETYGMTETASHIGLKKIGNDRHFTPQTGVDLSLKNDCLKINIPEVSISIETNDIASILDDGTFSIHGRADDVINSGGLKIHPLEIESKIDVLLREKNLQVPFYVSSILDEELGQRLVLIIQSTSKKNTDELLLHLKNNLPKNKAPKSIHLVKNIPMTTTNKIIRKPLSFYLGE